MEKPREGEPDAAQLELLMLMVRRYMGAKAALVPKGGIKGQYMLQQPPV